jgi:hypothetical protein
MASTSIIHAGGGSKVEGLPDASGGREYEVPNCARSHNQSPLRQLAHTMSCMLQVRQLCTSDSWNSSLEVHASGRHGGSTARESLARRLRAFPSPKVDLTYFGAMQCSDRAARVSVLLIDFAITNGLPTNTKNRETLFSSMRKHPGPLREPCCRFACYCWFI